MEYYNDIIKENYQDMEFIMCFYFILDLGELFYQQLFL